MSVRGGQMGGEPVVPSCTNGWTSRSLKAMRRWKELPLRLCTSKIQAPNMGFGVFTLAMKLKTTVGILQLRTLGRAGVLAPSP